MTYTYKLEKAPVPAISWEKYKNIIDEGWRDLLNASPPPGEKRVQNYLECHPSLVPGSGLEEGQSPCYTALISQPPLPSYGGPIPDFMWLSFNSEVLTPVLIEIEAPAKRWFTSEGRQTSDLTQSLDQIAQWKVWFGDPHNVAAFRDYYLRGQEYVLNLYFRPKYVLIYGRREKANAQTEIARKRAVLSPEDVTTMTYDRLTPNPRAEQIVCIKMNIRNRLQVVSVPPTLQLGPSFAHERANMVGLDHAIENNPYIPTDRKQFLIRRLAYWNQWARQDKQGFIEAGAGE